MNSDIQLLLKAAVVLAIFALVGTTLMYVTNQHAEPYIKANEQQRVLRAINTVLKGRQYNNDIVNDRVSIAPVTAKTDALPVYRARNNDAPVAAVLTVIAPDGYAGPIKMLVGIDYKGEVLGVRIISHRETPGLGDGFEPTKSDWIHSFIGKSLFNTGTSQWHVRKDGGVFDQFTGATISPRAIVAAVHRALQLFHDKRDGLFATDAGETISLVKEGA